MINLYCFRSKLRFRQQIICYGPDFFTVDLFYSSLYFFTTKYVYFTALSNFLEIVNIRHT
jgi:hypothetical protein